MKSFDKKIFVSIFALLFSFFTFSANWTFTSPNVALGSNIGCTSSSYTFTQTIDNVTAHQINAGVTVTIVFPAGVNISTATMAGSSFNGANITTGWTISGQTLSFSAPTGVIKKTTFSIVIVNITNGGSIAANASISIPNSGGDNNVANYAISTTACPTVPLNNDCTGAFTLTPAAAGSGTCTTTNGTTYGATPSVQPVCGGVADDDVWYKFTANGSSHQVTVDGITGFNPQIEVFQGSCGGTFTSISCLNSTGDGGVETASLTGLISGNVYFVRVYHSLTGFGSTSTASFTICVTSTLPPCNIGTVGNVGSTASPVSLPYNGTGLTNCGAGNDITSSNVASCGSTSYFAGEDNVIIFKPTLSGNISINLTSASSWVGITLYEGCPTAGGTCVAFAQSSSGNQSIGCAAVVANQLYYLVVDTYPSPTCIPSYNVSISAPTGGIPPGTTCSNAVPMTLPYSATGQSTLCFGNDYSNASPASCGTLYESGEDKVYTFTTTGADCFALTLSNASTSDIGYQVYAGCPDVAGSACISNGGGATSGTLLGNFSVPSAGTYYLVVDTYASPSYVNYDIQLVSLGGAPSNDLACNAQPIGIGVVASGDNQCSSGTSEPGAASSWTSGALNTVWYSFAATTTAMKVKVTPGTLSDPQVAVYSGACTSPTVVGSNQNIGSCGSTTDYSGEVSLTGLTVGSTYWIRIDGAYDLTGTFQVVVIDATMSYPPVQGQDCGSPNPVCNAVMSISNPGYSGLGNSCDFGDDYCLASGERNVVWYTIPITGGTSGTTTGTLNFNIVPNDFNYIVEDETDYDFAIWKVNSTESGAQLGTDYYSCATISAGTAPPVACNYSSLGVTGVGAAGNPPTSFSTGICPTCPGSYNPSSTYGGSYETSIATVSGDVYLLAVSNYSNSTSGFKIEFSTTGTATIDFAAGSNSSAGVIWTGGAASPNSNSWTEAANWGGCSTPSCSKDATVAAFANEPILTSGSTFYAKNVTIQSGATLTLQANAVLEICGNLANYGTINAHPNSTIRMVGGANQSMLGNLVGANRLGNLTIAKSSSTVQVTLMNDLELGGTFTTSNATSVFNSNGKYISVAGNFYNNNGNVTFTNTGTTGTLEFNGSSLQVYNQGSTDLPLNAVLVNNTSAIGSGVSLATDMLIKTTTGTLTLSQGTITTGGFKVVVINTEPTSVSVGSSGSFIDGNLRRYLLATGDYNWPVGNVAKGYQRARTSFTAGGNLHGYVDARFDVWPATLGYPPIQGGGVECGQTYSLPAMDNGYWTMTPGTVAASTYNMSLFPTNVTNAAVGWTIMKKPVIGPMPGWILQGTCTASTVTQVNRNGMSGFSVFGVAQSVTPLPIQLLQFDGEMVGEDNLLSWTTASEHNNDYFTLERSRNGVEFETLAIVQGAGNTSNTVQYSSYDYDPFNGVTYYRLKQTDFNGHYSYSQVIALNRGLSFMLVSDLYPNPTNDVVQFTVDSPKNGTIRAELFDVSGRSILTTGFDVHHGANSFTIKLNDVARGVYNLVLHSDLLEQTELKQVIKH